MARVVLNAKPLSGVRIGEMRAGPFGCHLKNLPLSTAVKIFACVKTK
jgi:hypothetical protein